MAAQTPHAHRVTFNSPVVLGFVFLCVAERLLSMATGGLSTRALFMTYHSSLTDPLTYVRMVTHVFGHSGWDHLVSNMSYVLLLGPLLEEKYGSRTLAEIMVLTALACSLANFVLFPRLALCGASGICFAFILLSSVTSLEEGEIPLTFLLVAALFLGQQVVAGVLVQDDVSNLSHVIGGLVGAAAGFALANTGRQR
ncbi:MAG: rhomboid family intramembrane serine protease [Atopobiaceae bacterium]|nr:rhomboid family intramembrane serine protease [Atopobiaceae bacterium]MBR1828101.1 rhomboid family intramembrane serine protease [Atopobiaceae bacterium]